MTSSLEALRAKYLPKSLPTLTLNEEQEKAISLALSGKSFCLTGAAGTGKTTTLRYIISKLLESDSIPTLLESTKVLSKGNIGIWAGAYTRRATNQIRQKIDSPIAFSTIHALLEYEPVLYDELQLDGTLKRKFKFEPKRTADNPLPSSLKILILDETSMLSVELFSTLLKTLHPDTTLIFVGDIFQLPPVFGDAILGYKLQELPVIELKRVYRQEKNSAILDLAWKIKDGQYTASPALESMKSSQLSIYQWKKPISPRNAARATVNKIIEFIENGTFSPYDGDLLLCPFNISDFGNVELNNYIAHYFDTKSNRLVSEIICGFNKKYLAVGDKILIDKEDAIITRILHNKDYKGQLPTLASNTLDRWGMHTRNVSIELSEDFESMIYSSSFSSSEEIEEREHQASHIVYYKFLNSSSDSPEQSISSSSDLNRLELAYSISIHKAQGSQADNVILALHRSHDKMISRELLYTAITRAAKTLKVFCEPYHFVKGVSNVRIKGNTIQEKAEFFKGKIQQSIS